MEFKFLLHSIHNINTKEEVLKEKSNRICRLTFSDNLREMIIKYQTGGTLKHFEEVKNIEITDSSVYVTTDAKVWRFDFLDK